MNPPSWIADYNSSYLDSWYFSSSSPYLHRVPGDLEEKAFGQVLRAIRTKQGLSQEALAFACGLSSEYISMLERGKQSPTARTIFALAAALEIKPSEIFKRVEKVMSDPNV